MFKCGKCGTVVESITNEVRCANCAYKVLYKMRSPVSKLVSAQ
ncbi:MAG: DNA-directed RNA polymerase subunit P [Candidatus Diapherotrites archaeon]|nr:DNA-directed RNA polymerase subunit P [Candidatus Diapherotrites archaeon]